MSQIARAGSTTEQYQGFTALEKTGASIWMLTGTMTATAPWTVIGGMLDVEGSITSSRQTTVNSGGTLSGAGIVGNTLIQAGGALMPDNAMPGSAMTVSGDLTLQEGVLYVVNVSADTSSTSNVSGTAAIGGASVNAMPLLRNTTPS